MSWPESDPYMHELRRKWDEGHFHQDADSVYGIDETIDEAITEISTYDDRPPGFQEGQTLTGTVPFVLPLPFEYHLGQELAKGMFDSIDRQFGDKTCRVCRLTARNDPCDTCYGRWRKASQTPSEAGFCVFCRNKSPSVICVPCVERVLKDGLG